MPNKTKLKKKETPEERYKRLADRIIRGEITAYLAQTHIPMLLQIFEQGHHIAHFCKEAEISETTFFNWVDIYPEFKAAYRVAKDICKTHYEDIAIQGLTDSNFNTTLWTVLMRNKFGYTDKRKIKINNLAKSDDMLEAFKTILAEIQSGKLTTDEANHLVGMLAVGVKISENTSMAKDIELLKEAILKESK
jgi:hypothetical protein